MSPRTIGSWGLGVMEAGEGETHRASADGTGPVSLPSARTSPSLAKVVSLK